jgi:hypothetical protein
VPTSRPPATGLLLARVVLLAGLAGVTAACGGDGDETAGASATSTAAAPVATSTTSSQPQVATSSAPSSDVRVVEVTITNGQVQTADDRVELARVKAAQLVVTSDVEDERTYTAAAGSRPNCPPVCRRRSTSRSTNRACITSNCTTAGCSSFSS